MRTPRLWLGLMSAVVLVATACSSGSSSSAPQASAPSSAGTAPSSVPGSAASGGELLIWADEKRAAAIKPLAAQFGD